MLVGKKEKNKNSSSSSSSSSSSTSSAVSVADAANVENISKEESTITKPAENKISGWTPHYTLQK